ncbi:hypothetical protein BGZ96_011818 [Linnemannia gamsii]|uniref:Uncharacterized protein n=1 Tax=Linnemannia gamsii TaxID=64522 RepID=A0ABQ7JSI8_9FUNG|nr:hypothetical protein BGZ96_011818 [Linnemannia gamsii]
MKLDGSENFEEVPIDIRPFTPTPTTTTITATALVTHQKLDSSIEEVDVDMKHDGQSSPTSSAQIPVAVGHTTLFQALRKVPSMTINTNYSNVDLTNGVRSHSSASSVTSSLHRTSFKTPTGHRHTTTTNNDQEQDPSAPKRRKTLLKSMSSSMRMAKKRAADILFGSARNKPKKKSKTLLPDQDDVDEGSLVTKVEDHFDDDEDYDMSRLSLSSTVVPSVFGLLGSTASLSRVNPSSSPMDVEVISLASCSSQSSDHITPPLTAAVAADLLQMSSWPESSNGFSLFTRSAEDLTRLPTSSFYDFTGCDPSITDNGHQTLVVESEAGPQHWHCLRRRSHSVSADCTVIPQEISSASSSSFSRHLNLDYDLEDIDVNDEGVKQSHDELQRSTFSRFGGLGSRRWIFSKNRLPSFMTKYRRSGKKDQKGTTACDANGLVPGCVRNNRSDPLRDRDVGELMELIVVDTPDYSMARKTNKIARKHSIRIPSSSSSSSSSSHTSSPSFSPTCATPFQHAIEHRKKTQQYQHQYKKEREEQQQSVPTSKAFRGAALTPDAFPTPSIAITCQPPPPSPSIVVSSAQGCQQVLVPNP